LYPDLWAIRQFTVETGDWLAASAAPQTPAPPPARPLDLPPTPFPLTESEAALVLEWQRLRDRGATDHGALLTADRAIKILVRRGRLSSAAEVSGWAITAAIGVIQSQGETPEALRDLSISLGNLGTLEQAAGHAQTAKNLLQEGLDIAERLAAALPDHVDYRELPAWFRQRIAAT
jgi:hypothetical protein